MCYGAFNDKVQKDCECWHYGNIAVARLGLTEEARSFCLKKLLYPPEMPHMTSYGARPVHARFPAFWVTYPFDAFPDMDHGGSAMIGLQMLVQTPDERIFLLPAWPKQWDVAFKLRAPKRTTVECVYRGGKIEHLDVQPVDRRKTSACPPS